MGILDRLYQPTVKDIGAGQANVRRFFKAIAASAVATTATTLDPEITPNDIVRLITNVSFSWTPGAAQTAITANLISTANGGAAGLQGVSAQPTFSLAAQQAFASVGGLQILLMQGEQLQLSGTFSAGANLNSLSVVISGWEFPRASIQR